MRIDRLGRCVLAAASGCLPCKVDNKHILNTKLFLTLTPAGADSDLNATTTAPSQAEVTDLNRSDHSTTSKKWPRGELW